MAKSKLNASKGSASDSLSQKGEQQDKSAFFTVLCYCLTIIFLPIVGFFSSKYLLFDTVLKLSSTQSNIYSAIVAVVALHLALFLYIYRAYFDTDSKDKKGPKKD